MSRSHNSGHQPDYRLLNLDGPENKSGYELRAPIRRKLSPASFELLKDVTQLVADGAGFYAPFGYSDIGCTLLKKSELTAVRQRRNSRLGALSYDRAMQTIEGMMPASTTASVAPKIDRFILSRPLRGRSYLLAGLTGRGAEIISTERHELESAIDIYEDVYHQWGRFRPHLTIGSFRADEVGSYVMGLRDEVQAEFRRQQVTLLPAEYK